MESAVEIAGLFGLLVVLIGVWGVTAPASIMEFATRWASKGGMWLAAAIRIIFGLALWFAASASRAPLLLQVLGAITVLAGVVLPFLGVDRFKALIEWAQKLSPIAIRLWCLLAVALGAVILWALAPSAT